MANNNGNIIGAAHSSYSGVWDTQDQYQQALANNWPVAAVSYWEPTSNSTCIKHNEAQEDITSNYVVNTSGQPWVDQSTEGIDTIAVNTGGSNLPAFLTTISNSATSVYGSNVAVDYHPLRTGVASNQFFNHLKSAPLSSATSELTAAFLFRIGSSTTQFNAPIISFGRDELESGAQSRNSFEVLDFVTDGTPNFRIVDGTGGVDISTGASVTNGAYYSVVLRADSTNETVEWNILSSASTTETNNSSATGSKSSGSFALNTDSFLIGSAYMSNSDTAMTRLDGEQIEYYDIAMWDSLLSDSEVEKLQGYHYHKYGITNIPSGHPYASSAPTG